MGGATALLGGLRTPRGASAVALLAVLAGYYAAAEHLPNVSNNWDVALVAAVLIPAVFALVWLSLPLWRARGLLPVALALGALVVILTAADLEVAANFAKLAAMTLLAFWFLAYFESVAWVALVAAIIPVVDAWSVWRGPTSKIVEEREDVFTTLSIAFPVPGENTAANLGLPDLLFFGLFLAASVRWHLRTAATWAGMTASFAATMLLTVVFDVRGLPALPLLSVAFLAVNADLIWRALRRHEQGAPEPDLQPRVEGE